MKLPNGDRAIIDKRKIVDYCLSFEHDEGKHKAGLFRDLLGLTTADAVGFSNTLREAAANGEAVLGRADHYGQRYVVDFAMEGARGGVVIRSVWIVRSNEVLPRLVTCYIM